MDVFLGEWVNLLLRWFHMIVGIGWIGTSFYFMALDFGLDTKERKSQGVYGTAWQVHGGGFYHVEKFTVAPPQLPAHLHWFKWDAYLTWMTGFGLLIVQYYLHAKSYLKTKNLDAVEIEQVNLSGLSLRVPKYQIKMWKSEGSDLPVPGASEPKQEFYQQPLFPNGTEQPNPLRLAVLWNIDWQKNLAAVWLVCPKYGDEKSAEAHWCVKIPDPALASVPVVAAPTVLSELPIKRKAKKATGTTDN